MRFGWLLLLLAGCGFVEDTAPAVFLAADRPVGAVVLSYLAFDNDKDDLWNQLPEQLNVLEQTGSSSTLSLFAQVDGAKPQDGRRYRIIRHPGPGIVSPFDPLPEEVDTSKPEGLSDFLSWGKQQAPAAMTLVEIIGHGEGWKGVARDDSAGVQYLPLPQLAEALKRGVGKAQVVSLDACSMATLEALADLHGAADYLVASEDSTLLLGFMTGRHLAEIVRAGNAEAIAKELVLQANRHGKGVDRPGKKGPAATVFTASALRLNEAPRLLVAWDQLSGLLIARLPEHKAAIRQAILGSRPLYVTGHFGPDDGQRDVYHLLGRLQDVVPDPELRRAADQVRRELQRVIALARRHPANPMAQGLAVQIRPDLTEYQGLQLARTTRWDELLSQL